MNASPRSFAAESAARRPRRHAIACGGCGAESHSELSLETHAELLRNVGWEIGAAGDLRCPKCIASSYVARVQGSKGAEYVVRTLDGVTTCTCKGFEFRHRCKHSDAAPKATPAPTSDEVQLLVRDERGGEEIPCSLTAFIDSNAADLATCSDVRSLAVGEQIRLGGGASPVVTVRRTA
jgi:hypothetical protein